MAKVVKFPTPSPAKFGLQKVRKQRGKCVEKPGQLNLFTGGKVVRLNQLSLFEEALLLDDNGDRIAAKNLYNKAIEANDCMPDAYCNLGIIESLEGNIAKAINCFTRCLKNEPRHYEAHYNLANLYSEISNFPLAKAHYEIAIELEPSFPNSYFNLGLSLAMNKEYKEAVVALIQYKDLAPQEEHQQTDELIAQLKSI